MTTPEPLPGTPARSSAVLGFDCLHVLTADECAAFAAGPVPFNFVVRYVNRGVSVNKGACSRDEALRISHAGLALMLVQKAKRGMLGQLFGDPDACARYGATVGRNAAINARNLGYPPACTLWMDIEAVSGTASIEDVLAYSNAWHSAATAAGHVSLGIYVGPASRLTTDVLYSKLRFPLYWKAASKVPNVNERGFSMLQSLSTTIHGVRVDLDIAAIDSKGGRPMWLEAPSAPPTDPCRDDRCDDEDTEDSESAIQGS